MNSRHRWALRDQHRAHNVCRATQWDVRHISRIISSIRRCFFGTSLRLACTTHWKWFAQLQSQNAGHTWWDCQVTSLSNVDLMHHCCWSFEAKTFQRQRWRFYKEPSTCRHLLEPPNLDKLAPIAWCPRKCSPRPQVSSFPSQLIREQHRCNPTPHPVAFPMRQLDSWVFEKQMQIPQLRRHLPTQCTSSWPMKWSKKWLRDASFEAKHSRCSADRFEESWGQQVSSSQAPSGPAFFGCHQVAGSEHQFLLGWRLKWGWAVEWRRCLLWTFPTNFLLAFARSPSTESGSRGPSKVVLW